MLVLLWWLIPIGAVLAATWWVYAVAPTDVRHPDKPKSRRQLDRMGEALNKPVIRRTNPGRPEVVVDVTESQRTGSDR